MSDDEVVRIAKDHARTAGQSLEGYHIVLCEQPSMWRVIFDGGGPEYIINKKDQKVLGVINMPQGRPNKSEVGKVTKDSPAISKETAIAVSRADGEGAYGSLDLYDVVGCELNNSWRIIYAVKGDNVGGGPEYVVDKWSGKIIHKKYFQ